jgi:hypothetical protein
VAGQIEQNVDAIVADLLRENRIRDIGNRIPMLHVSAQTRRDVVLEGASGVRMQLQISVIAEVRQNRFQERRHRVIAQIPRHESDLEPAVGIRNVAVLRPMGLQVGFKLLAHPPVFHEQGVRVDVRVVGQDIEQIGIALRIVHGKGFRAQRNGRAQAGLGLGVPTLQLI